MSDNTKLKGLLEDYLTYLEVERQVSPYTLRNYRHYLERFNEWLVEERSITDPRSISLKDVSDYRVFLARYQDEDGQTLSRVTQSYHIIAIRAWFAWLLKRDIDVLAPDKIDLPKTEDKSLHYLDIEQVERLMNQPRVSTEIGLRDRAIMEVLFSTGLRVSELVSLDRDQVNLEKREFGVVGKGRKIRVVFLSERAVKWLDRYLVTREDEWKPVFIRYSREQAPLNSDGEDMRLSVRSVQRIVAKYRKRARLNVPITPHGLRHSFATDLLRNGAGLREVQELLGHKNVSTTQVYTHVTNPQLKDVHDKHHSGND